MEGSGGQWRGVERFFLKPIHSVPQSPPLQIVKPTQWFTICVALDVLQSRLRAC